MRGVVVVHGSCHRVRSFVRSFVCSPKRQTKIVKASERNSQRKTENCKTQLPSRTVPNPRNLLLYTKKDPFTFSFLPTWIQHSTFNIPSSRITHYPSDFPTEIPYIPIKGYRFLPPPLHSVSASLTHSLTHFFSQTASDCSHVCLQCGIWHSSVSARPRGITAHLHCVSPKNTAIPT